MPSWLQVVGTVVAVLVVAAGAQWRLQSMFSEMKLAHEREAGKVATWLTRVETELKTKLEALADRVERLSGRPPSYNEIPPMRPRARSRP